jgi:transcriptional regulator with XRE-family HTH domain
MDINETTLTSLAVELGAARRRQKLSREDAAAVCGVSTSFIRDAESNPEHCTLGKLARLIHGLGLGLELTGQHVALVAQEGLSQGDYGVADSQLLPRTTRGSEPLDPGEPS